MTRGKPLWYIHCEDYALRRGSALEARLFLPSCRGSLHGFPYFFVFCVPLLNDLEGYFRLSRLFDHQIVMYLVEVETSK